MMSGLARGRLHVIPSLILVTALAFASPAVAFPSSGDSGGSSDSPSGGSGGASSGPSVADAQSLVDRGRWRDSIDMLRTILASEPRNADALNLMGYSLRRSGDMGNAEVFYLRAIEIRPKHRGANEYLGELYVETGNLPKAQTRLDALEAICGTSCREYLELKKAIDGAS